jgi:5-methylcytosine-specific restriction endonuclease McrA
MAIRIIDDKPHKSVVKEQVCTNCGVTLEYVPADVKEFVHHDYGGGSDVVRYIVCPKCQHQQRVK